MKRRVLCPHLGVIYVWERLLLCAAGIWGVTEGGALARHRGLALIARLFVLTDASRGDAYR